MKVLKTLGATFQVKVDNFKKGETWYKKLFGREPDLVLHHDFSEWEIAPDTWFQVGGGKPEIGRPIRFGVKDIHKERDRVISELNVEVSQIGDVEPAGKVAYWCDFEDPFGNKLGFFQDLAKYPNKRSKSTQG